MSVRGGFELSWGRLAQAVGAAVLLSFTVSEAAAEPAFCDQLRAQYVSASRSAGSGDTASLRRQLGAAQAEARRRNCMRFGFFGPRPSGQCPAIMARVNRLQQQLNRSNGFGWGFVDRNQASFDRDRLRASLSRNGCAMPLGGPGGSGYRTLCVRTCDGYYFPISSSTSQGRFKIDDSVCRHLYGGAEAEVYVHHNSSPVETARSLTGKSYTDLVNAFAFRQNFSLSCQAELHTGLKAIAAVQEVRVAQYEADQKADPASLLPHPLVRVAGSEDPETLANLAGNFRVEPLSPPEPDATGIGPVADMRQIGPDYYYAPPVTIEGLKARPARPIDFNLIGTAHADEKPADEPVPQGTSVH